MNPSDGSRDIGSVCTVAGSDCSGAAGMQTDLPAFLCVSLMLADDCGGRLPRRMCALSAVTAQGPAGAARVRALPAEELTAQLEAIAAAGAPRAVKIGALASAENVDAVARFLASMRERRPPFVVCDPIFSASSGATLLEDSALTNLRALLRGVDLVTPNLGEAGRLLGGAAPGSWQSVAEAAAELSLRFGARAALIKGGHAGRDFGGRPQTTYDCWSDGKSSIWLACPTLPEGATRGSGCALSSAIAAGVAQGLEAQDALVVARAYVQRGMRRAHGASGQRMFAHDSQPLSLDDLPRVVGDPLRDLAERDFPACGARAGEAALGVYPVVPDAGWAERMFALGASTVQLRVKDRPAAEVLRQARRAAQAARDCGARLFVNDHWQAAIDSGAYGAHLGQEDLASADLDALRRAGLRLGISAHSWFEIARAHALRPSYVAIGPIYETTSKEMRFAPQGLAKLRRWTQLLSERYPVVAIGGIDCGNAAEVAATGVESLALIRAITDADDPARRWAELTQIFANARRVRCQRPPEQLRADAQ